MGSGMAMNVLLLVRGFAKLGEFLKAGMQNQDIPVTHLHPALDHFRSVEIQLANLITQIDNHSRPVQPVQRDLVDGLSTGHKMTRRIQVGAHVIGCHDILSIDPMLRLALDVLHFKGRIIGPKRGFLI